MKAQTPRLSMSPGIEKRAPSVVADLVAEALSRAGAEFGFGVAGGEVLRLIDSLNAAGVRYVAARQESAAGFMADGSHRAGQPIGVLVATLGPGVANAVLASAHALQDGVPLIILGGRVSLKTPPEFRHQVFDQESLFRPVTKSSITLRAETALQQVEEAILLAQTAPEGPVYIDCPQDEMEIALGAIEVRTAPRRAPRADVLTDDTSELGYLLAQAERPLLLCGLGALAPQSTPALERFLAAHPMPVLTTYKAKGVLPESHELVLGGAGLSPRADKLLLPLVERADLVLLAGYDPIEMRSNWNRPFDRSARVFSLGRAAARRAGPVATDVIEGPLDQILNQIEATTRSAIDRAPWLREVREKKQKLYWSFASRGAWEPAALFERMQAMLEPGSIVTVDTGAHRILLSQQWSMAEPNRLLQSSGLCTMACAIPMAIGAKLMRPDASVVAVLGDGGLEMAAGELATLRDEGLKIRVVVVDDGGYGLIDMKQRARDFETRGVLFGRSDYEALAEAFGGRGYQVSSLEEFERAFSQAAQDETFALIQARFDRGSYDGRI